MDHEPRRRELTIKQVDKIAAHMIRVTLTAIVASPDTRTTPAVAVPGQFRKPGADAAVWPRIHVLELNPTDFSAATRPDGTRSPS